MQNAIYFAVLCLIWGSTWMAIKINLTAFPPFYSAGFRFLLAGFILLIVMKIKKVNFPEARKEVAPSLVFGVLNGFSYGLVYWGEQFISSGLTAILNASLPFFSIIFAAIFIGERITFSKIIGSVVGFGGVLLLFYEGLSELGTGKVMGEVAIVAASAVYALAGVHVKKRSTAHPLVAVTVQMFAAAAVLLVIAMPAEYQWEIRFTWQAFTAYLYLSLIGSALAFYLYNELILRMEVTKLGYIAMVTPAIATMLGVALMGEHINRQMLIGMALILVGTAVINMTAARKLWRGNQEVEPLEGSAGGTVKPVGHGQSK